jgi:aspartyl-tRNA synthetase
MKTYGNDKPDIRFEMKFGELNAVAQHKDFPVFNSAELVVGIAALGLLAILFYGSYVGLGSSL